MTTILPKEPVVTDRKTVILSDAERRNLRRKLKGTVAVAQSVLNPRNQFRQLFTRNAAKVKDAAGDAGRLAKRNAPLIGAIGLGALLFAARQPISDWISGLRKTKTTTPDGD